MALPVVKHMLFLFAIVITAMTGCATKGASTSALKVGMHIDAVLEFVVEYPLNWQKDRRLEYGRNEGEVRWVQPTRKETMLRVASHFREYQTRDQELDLALKDYPGLTETLREQVDLPGGEAWHVIGKTVQQQLDFYLFLRPDRAYMIALQTSPEHFEEYAELMQKIIFSFQVLSQ